MEQVEGPSGQDVGETGRRSPGVLHRGAAAQLRLPLKPTSSHKRKRPWLLASPLPDMCLVQSG